MDGGRGKPHRADRSGAASAGLPDGVASYYELTATDRLGLLDRCSKELRRRALLLDPDRVFELCALRIALTSGAGAPTGGEGLARETTASGHAERGPVGDGHERTTTDDARAGHLLRDEAWIARRIAGAIDQARRLDRELAAHDGALVDHQDYRFLTDVFFVPLGAGPRAAHAFNQLPRNTRRATLELLLYGKPIEQCLAEGIASDVQSLTTQARKGLLAIMQIDEAMLRTSKPKSPTAEEGGSS